MKPAGTTGRFIVSFDAGAPNAALLALHRLAGVKPTSLGLAAAPPAAGEGAAGLISADLGFAVLTLPSDATAPLAGSTALRIRAERVFQLPKPFRPKPVRRASRATPGLGLAPAASATNAALAAVGIVDGQPTGRGVRVAVLDSGIWQGHPDFAHREIHARSFVEGTDADDVLGHGTFCAGILAGPRIPSEGPRYGVAPDVDLYVGRVIGDDERAREGDVLAAISWALESGCRIISLSVGALPDAAPDADYEALASHALARRCLIVAAAGNDSARPAKKPVRIPANSSGIVAVAAATNRGFALEDSNAGLNLANGGGIDVSAPGSEVYSCCAPAGVLYATEGGTSAATPFVAGVAAQHLERDPEIGARDLWARLVAGARAQDLVLPKTGAEDVGARMIQALR